MTLLPKLKLKSIVSFPSNVYGGTGIDVVKTNGNFTINLDYSEFGTSGTLPPNTNALVWDPVTDTYYLVPPSAVGGISDAPSDGKMYGRYNHAWVDAWASPVLTGNPTAPTPTAGDNDTSIATTAFVASAVSTVTITGGVTYTPQSPTVSQQTVARQNVYAAPFDAMAYSGMQINGSMEVSQELGTTGTVTHNAFICDGWRLGRIGTWAGIGSAALNSPFAGFQSWLNVSVTTAEPSIAVGSFGSVRTRIEGYRTSRLAWGVASAQPITIAFWSAHVRTGVYSVAVRNSASNRSYATTYTQAVTNGWQYNVVTIPGDVTGTWEVTNLAGLDISFAFASGGTFTAPSANTWVDGNFVAAPGQINAVAATSDVFRITGFVVLPGIEAPSAARSPLIMRPYDQELVLCQRYYWASNPNFPKGDSIGSLLMTGVAPSVMGGSIRFPVSMRSAPTMTLWSIGTQNQVRNSNNGVLVALAPPGYNVLNRSGLVMVTANNNPFVLGTPYDFDLIADARL